MRLGLLVEAEEGLTWPAWRSLLHTAETLDFESVWVSDHFASPWSIDQSGIEPWMALAVAAADTHHVRLGPLVSPITFRPPIVLARMARSLADLSQGRFVLGLGLGWHQVEHERFQLPFPPLAERIRHFEQAIALIRAEGGGDLPLLIGGMGPRSSLPLAARYADEWNITTASPSVFADRLQVLANACVQVGRDPARMRRSVATGLLIGRDPADLLERARRMQQVVPPLAGMPPEAVPAAARAMGWLVGSPPEVIEGLRALAAVGVDGAMLGIYDHDDLSSLQLVAETVMPALA